jgi:DNA topoisomerase IB
MREVSSYLGNTPAVCRSSYVDPRVVDHFRAGATILPALDRLPSRESITALSQREAVERAVLALLGDEEQRGEAA